MSDSLWLHGLYPARLLYQWVFSRQEYWSGLPFPPLGIEPASPASLALPVDSLPPEPSRKPVSCLLSSYIIVVHTLTNLHHLNIFKIDISSFVFLNWVSDHNITILTQWYDFMVPKVGLFAFNWKTLLFFFFVFFLVFTFWPHRGACGILVL